jgi:hypothetical protein
MIIRHKVRYNANMESMDELPDTEPLNPEVAAEFIFEHKRGDGSTCGGGVVTVTGTNRSVGMVSGTCGTCKDDVVKAPKGWISMADLRG